MYKKISILIIASVIATGLFVWPNEAYAAGSASFSLTPSSGSQVNGSQFTVYIKEMSNDQINAVQANLSYDPAVLQLVSLDTSGSSFNYPLAESGGDGSVNIARGVSGGSILSGTQNVGALTFKVLSGTGNTTISFVSSSAIIRPSDGQNVWNGNTAGATFALSQPAANAPPQTPRVAASSPSSAQPEPNTGDRGHESHVSQRAAPQINTQTQNPEAPVPVSSITSVNPGHLVAIKVVDRSGNAMHGASVMLYSQSATTDKTGVASFSGIPSGGYTVSVEAHGNTIAQNIEIKEIQPVHTVQEFTIKFDKGKAIGNWWLYGGIAALLVLIIGLLLVSLFKRRRKLNKANTRNSSITTMPKPTTKDSNIIRPEHPDQTDKP